MSGKATAMMLVTAGIAFCAAIPVPIPPSAAWPEIRHCCVTAGLVIWGFLTLDAILRDALRRRR